MGLPLDEEVLNALREKVRVEDEANRLKQRELTLLKRRQAVFDAVFERYAGLGERASSLLAYMEAETAERCLQDEALREYFDELSEAIQSLADRLDRHERVLILLLTEQTGQEKQTAAQGLKEIQALRDKKRLLEKYLTNLQRLREREARYGANDAPTSLLNEIEETERKIDELKEE